MSKITWRVSGEPTSIIPTHTSSGKPLDVEHKIAVGALKRCNLCSRHFGDDSYHVALDQHGPFMGEEEPVMGDRYDPKERAYMAKVAPLVDEVILAMAEAHPIFAVTDVQAEIRAIFEEKGQPWGKVLNFLAWSDTIRGRLTKLGFELNRQKDGTFGWQRVVENAAT